MPNRGYTISLGEDDIAWLESESKSRGISASAVIRELIRRRSVPKKNADEVAVEVFEALSQFATLGLVRPSKPKPAASIN